MCGRVVWVWDPATGLLVKKYDERATDDPEVAHLLKKNRFNVPPMSHLPVVFGGAAGTRVGAAHWGVPVPNRPSGVFNTRIETAFESPLWRSMMGTTHCVFIVRGFYEWQRKGRLKFPHFIHRADAAPMLLAGVWSDRHVKGSNAPSASVVTCAPNALMGTLHDRMPVVLEPDAADAWLAQGPQDRAAVAALAVPAGDDVLVAHEVSGDVNSTDNDAPNLPEAVERKKWF